jgi:hypothetical protein
VEDSESEEGDPLPPTPRPTITAVHTLPHLYAPGASLLILPHGIITQRTMVPHRDASR